MGKFVRKARIGGEKAVVEAAHPQPSLGARTRARTLTLKRFHESSLQVASSYLQLRSRRLEKHFPVPSSAKSRAASKNRQRANRDTRISTYKPAETEVNPVTLVSLGSASTRSRCSKEATTGAICEASPEGDAEIEASSGENVLEFDRCMSARETTPCSLIRDSETIVSLGSTTWPTKSTASIKLQASVASCIPTAFELEEFFSGPEQLQQRSFMEKYNFDVVKDQPLPGRYEWVKLDP
ncbi:unnamed protein product [Musa acuminata subsp. malaccensis]|uniref:(wild Malaysian banana) hypothetical protein n=1 Tax=Musa acuminata subsp. malaccensis TaxID=214687 RepID=A0A804J7Z0_MUSAM|nr:unnamed protein product [Musa acuminata subsp. malaccensis]